MLKEAQYIRKGHVILEADTREVYKECISINAAKEESRSLQISVGGLGCGALKVEPHKRPKNAGKAPFSKKKNK